jgi:hypothetical protein
MANASDAADTAGAASLRPTEIASILLMLVSFLFGIGSIVATAIAWDDGSTWATWAAISTGGACLMGSILAVPLAYFAAKRYQQERIGQGQFSFGAYKGWMVLSWVLFGVTIFSVYVPSVWDLPG